MSDATRVTVRSWLLISLCLPLVIALSLHGRAQPQDTPKKSSESKALPAGLPVIKLPDGTYLWTVPSEGGGERVTLNLQDVQKLQDQVDQLKKLNAMQKASAPSSCAIHVRVEKRGEQLVGACKISYRFRTTTPQANLALGGRKGFLVSAVLDTNTLPILSSGEEGFTALIEKPGDHTLALELETPVSSRGSSPKTELGFDIGLPRAAITKFSLEPPRPDLKVVNITTRMQDPATPARPLEPRRFPVDIKQLAGKGGKESDYALGAVESLEVTWEPPSATAQPLDRIQSADLKISTVITEAAVETTAKINIRGVNRELRIVAPVTAEFGIESAASAESAPAVKPIPVRPTDASKPIWKIQLPEGSVASDWEITAVVRQQRSRSEDPKHRGPFPIGPFTVLDVLKQTIALRVTAGPNSRFSFKHGPEVRPILVTGPVDDDVTTAAFRMITGSTGPSSPSSYAALLQVEVLPQPSSIIVKPTYKLTLEKIPHSPDVWHIRAEIRVFPNHTTLEALTIEIPSEWPLGAEASIPAAVPSEKAPSVPLSPRAEGFWSLLRSRVGRGGRVLTVLPLPEGKKQPFDFILTANVSVPSGIEGVAIPLPRFPTAFERDSRIAVTVPEGQEITRWEARTWDGGSPASWVVPLNPVQAANGKSSKAVRAISGMSETGLSRIVLDYAPAPLDLNAEMTADATVSDQQTQVIQHIKLHSADGLPHVVHFHPTHPNLKVADFRVGVSPRSLGQYQIQNHSSGEGQLTISPDTRELNLVISFATRHARLKDYPAIEKVPVELFWPEASQKTDTTVRVWSAATSGRSIGCQSPHWRDGSTEPVPEGDTLPSLILSASSGELPLELELQEVTEQSAITVWVDRCLIQAWSTEDGGTRCRALFSLRRWLKPAVEIRLPETGYAPEFLIDGKLLSQKVTLLSSNGGPDRAYRIPIDATAGKNITLEVRYDLPRARGDGKDDQYVPPMLANASFGSGIRWLVSLPPGSLPILTSGASPEIRWQWRNTGLVPGPARSSRELEKWFQAGDELFVGEGPASTADESLTARQPALAPISVQRVSRIGFIVLSSVFAFLLCMVLSRLSASWLGPVIAVLAGGIACGVILLPHATAQLAGACQFGAAGAAAVLLLLAAVRSYQQYRVVHLPSFSRQAADAQGGGPPALPSSARGGRPSGVGSGVVAPVSPVGS